MQSATVIREAVVRLGEQRGAPRYFVNTRYLEEAGFRHGDFLELVPGEGTLVVQVTGSMTNKRVQSRKGLPLIDLNCKLLAETFRDADTIHVRVEARRIIMSVHPIDEQTSSRKRLCDGSMGSVFSGIGLMDEAARQAGYTPKWAVEIDPRTCAAFRDNHPDTTVFEMSAHEAAFMNLPQVELLALGLPCFTAGTLVLTSNGYIPIEDVRVGDDVLTHTGQWRKVLTTMRKPSPSIRVIKAQGFEEIRTTDEHPFYARRPNGFKNPTIIRDDGTKTQRRIRQFTDPAWLNAEELQRGDFVGQVVPADDPSLSEEKPEFWMLIGRYLGDGWTRIRSDSDCKRPSVYGSVVICADNDEVDEVAGIINAAGFHATLSPSRTVTRLIINKKWLWEFVQQFGKYAYGKRIPGWCLGLNKECARALCEGLLSADGHTEKRWKERRLVTTSRSLALSFMLLAQKAYGVVCSMRLSQRARVATIEGRTVQTRDLYVVGIPHRNRSAFVCGNYGWKRVRESYSVAEPANVYNLEVEGDNSYIVEGAIVHNCQPWSNVRTTTSAQTKRDRSEAATTHPLGDMAFWAAIIIAKINPRILVLENVPGFATSETAASLTGFLRRLGYHVDMRVLNAGEHGALTQRKRVVLVAQTPEADGSVRSPWPEPRECEQRVADVMDDVVDDSLWWDRTTHPNRFRRQEEARAKGRGFTMQVVRPEDDRLGAFTAEYGNAKVDVPVLAHPERPDTYRYFTLSEGKRIMGVRADYRFPDGVTFPWVLLGQAVVVPLFREIFGRLKSATPEQPALHAADAMDSLGDLPLFGSVN